MKILFLSHKFNPDIGGIETISEILAENFSREGHIVRLITWTKEPSKKKYPFEVIRMPGFFKLLKEHLNADIVFENNPSLRLSWPAIFFNRPSVISLQTWISKADGTVGWQERLKLKWLKRAKKVISCSEAIRKRCWSSSIVIGNPYQEDTFKILKNVSKTSDFIFLGRLVSDKGADLAIKAFHQLLYKSGLEIHASELKLSIVGSGPERERLEDLVAALRLQKNVVFTGAMRGEALVNFLNQHRFLLVPSVWEEPFGIVALEGMACGCLPIVSDGGGLPDAVGKAGLVFKRGDIDSFVQCMLKVLQDQEMKERMLQEAPPHLRHHCSVEVSNRYLAVLKSAFDNHRKTYLFNSNSVF
jgi:glycosyltransferase involved in cell wall biosynthesis